VSGTSAVPLAQFRQPTPFLKWAGGKGQLLPTLSTFLPTKFGRYFEPFVGGGAMFFHLYGQRPALNAVLSDLNEELINCYEVIRDQVDELIDDLRKHKNESDYFYKVRAQSPRKLTRTERAARIIYLNKTCFNGLYRVNSQGQFNVPFGSYKNPRTCDEENLRAVSLALAHADLSCSTFEQSLKRAKRGDLIYLDPPYQPISSTSNFTGYTKGCFSSNDQAALAELVGKLSDRGCKIMLSNSDNEYIRELYSDFRIETVYANRAINCKGDRRGKITEVLILNF
jgi:DNA adenine methylase